MFNTKRKPDLLQSKYVRQRNTAVLSRNKTKQKQRKSFRFTTAINLLQRMIVKAKTDMSLFFCQTIE